jgi:RNA polymerase sigma factor (TIGR02999 family)
MSDITQQLRQWYEGDRSTERQLFDAIYPTLRSIAQNQLVKNGGAGLTLQATEIANEGFMRLLGQNPGWEDRSHFFVMAATVIRRVVIDYLRERSALKRGAGEDRVSLHDLQDSVLPMQLDTTEEWFNLDRVLVELEKFDPSSARLVELRFFMGLSVQEIAELQKVSESTLQRQWRMARAWLGHRLQPNPEA